MKVEKLQLDDSVPIPISNGAVLTELDHFIANMKVGQSVRFKNYQDLTNFCNRARRYSRHHEANKWMFRTTSAGEYRIWRTS